MSENIEPSSNIAPRLEVFVASLPGHFELGLPLAASRAGAVGLLDLRYLEDADCARQIVAEFQQSTQGRGGLILSAPLNAAAQAALAAADEFGTIVLTSASELELRAAIDACRGAARRLGLIVYAKAEAAWGEAASVDFLIAKGHESAGEVGEETTFVLVQGIRACCALPLVAWGGISWNTAAAVAVAGCAGVVLDWQLALLRESPIKESFRRRLKVMDGSEVVTLAAKKGRYLRCYHQPGLTAKAQLEADAENTPTECARSGESRIAELLREARDTDRLWLVGQDAVFAADWAQAAPSVGRALPLLQARIETQIAAARAARALAEEGPLAQSHRTRFPIVQGPMTRVSDVPEFCQAVRKNGALPFLALALMEEAPVRKLLQRTQELVGEGSWGVGILGFVPQEIRAQQWAAIRETRPPFAIIAGGRPDQAATFEAAGIATYLHVPSPGMLQMFLSEGARRFVFEGRECGGHVGPRTSFVLWETMIRVLCGAGLSAEEAARVHVLFAGGIHDGLSAAMVSVLAQPLVERGMKIGALLGTAYLFTEEAVATGAIVPGFQEVAVEAAGTVVVEMGPGHAIRCAGTEFVELFDSEKRRLFAEQRPHEELRNELEHFNLGRLRVAAKGVNRSGPAGALSEVDQAEQRAQGMFMLGQVTALRAATCTLLELHEEVSHGAVRELEAWGSIEELVAPQIPPRPLDIAIVGMSCLLPGATDVATFWENVLSKHDPIGEIPPDRFEIDRWFDANRRARDKIYSRWGGFVPEVPFDPLKYGIPPASLKSIEPMQLLALELVDQALRDAGYDKTNPHRERTSVILGIGGGAGELGTQYAFRAMVPGIIDNPDESVWGQLPEWTEDSFAGILFNVVAGRACNRFDFGGTNCTIDAACASSLSAIYWACHELASGACDLAISGGCDTMQSAFGYLCFGTAGALSPRGRARVFDAGADGIVISEGHAALVLKRRADAERDGDKIYAVIRAVAAGSDGRSKGLATPRVEGQLRTLRRAYHDAGVSPASVQLFEAHGTGTAVGDQTEGQALSELLRAAEAAPQSTALGSIKSMIGHTKCAAGAVGMIKAALALHHRLLPPTLHVERPNPKAGLLGGPLFVNNETRPWLAGVEPRRAGVSSFGFGGTNFHVVLEEYRAAPQTRPLVARDARSCELFEIRAENRAAIAAAVNSFSQEVAAVSAAVLPRGLSRLALTRHLRNQKSSPRTRAAFVAGDLTELQTQIAGFLAAVDSAGNVHGKLPAGVYYTAAPLAAPDSVAFLFPGQGSQFPGMLRELAVEFPEVAASFERADAALLPRLGERLSKFIITPPAYLDADQKPLVERLKATRIAQPALGAAGIGVLRLLQAFALEPALTGGHSFGELVALCAAGSLSETDLFQLAAARGQAMHRETNRGEAGQMLAVSADAQTVRDELQPVAEVWVANLNGPRQTVISGSAAGIAAAQARFEAAHIATRQLPVAAAFHSPFMTEPRERFERVLAETPFAPPRLPVFGNVSAAAYGADPRQIREALAQQLISEVRFVEEIEAMYQRGARIFVEVGPKGVLTALVREILGDRPHAAIATQPSSEAGRREFLQALAQLAAHGVDVQFDRLYEDRTLEPIQRNGSALAAPAAYPAHAWLLNGAYCRPATEPKRTLVPRATLGSPAAAPLPFRLDERDSNRMRSPLEPSHGAPPTSPPPPSSSQSVPSQPLPSQPLPNPSSSHPLSSGPPPESAPRLPVERFASGQVPPEASGSALDAQAYAAFQETMRQFLLTQETVLEQLFRGPDHSAPPERSDVWPSSLGLSHRPSFAPPAPVVPHPQHTTNGAEYAFVSRVASEPSAAATPLASAGAEFAISAITTDGAAAADLQPAASAEPPHATAAPSQAETRDTHPRAVNSRAAAAPVDPPALANRLIEVVADRTGYPVEMLNLDTNLEGELGIDSIKRVEIIAAFRRDVLPQSQEPPAEFMERLTAAKTLRAIVDIVTEMLGGSAAPAAHTSAAPLSEPGEPAAGANSLDLDDLLATLVRIVAERTGYPVEMLDLDTNLEGELGIDSIKRVEIIAAFRREILPQLHEPPAEFMERLTAAKSMRVIVVAVAELLGLAADGAATPASAAAVSSASTPSWDAEDLTATLVRIVADRTGYPLEMLELETNLEGELGIDSIKRVEIIAAFRREVLPQLQEPPADFMERLTASKTMRAILDCFTTMLVGVTPGPRPAHASAVTHAASSAQAAVVSDASPAAKQNGARCPRCLAAMVETPLGPRDAISAGVYLLTADEAGVSAGVERLLTAAGATVARLSDADLRSRDTAAARVQAIRNEQGPIAGVLHLAPLSAAPAFPNVERSVWENALEREVLGLLFVLQAIEPELAKGESAAVRVLCGTLGGGDFDAAAELEAAHPWRGALAGLLKVAAKEWPQARFRLADFVEAPNPQSLLEELAAAGPVEIGYRGGRRLAIEMRPVELPDAAAGPGASRLTADSVVLVTGGAKGITAELVREMAVHTQATFVLLGRSAAPVHEEAAATAAIAGDAALRSAIIAHLRAGANACTPALVEAKLSEIKSGREIRRTLRAIEQVGGKVHYRSCDLRDADALPRCIAQIVAEFGPIEALVHGAGIIEDRAIMDKTAESFHRVVATKVQPVVTLLSLLDQLKVVALFASSSGVFGNAGQCDYAAANEILNRIARRWARSSGAKVVSYNWGPWAGVGMVTPEVARKMAAQGIALIEPAAGREAAWREIATSHAGSPRVILGAGPWLNAAVSPNNDSLRAAGPRAAAVPLRRETPLLAGQAVERRADGSIVARVLLDRRQPALADHCIDGKAVMPVMLGLALMAEVAQAGQPEWQVTTVEDLRMQAGISLTNARRELILHAERTSSAAAESAWRVRITTAETGVRVLYQATVQLAPGYPPAPDRLPVERIATAWETPAEKLYDEWLFHGPLYQAIQSFVGANAQGIDAIVQPSDAGQFMNRPQDQAASAARWLVDPVVLDVAPQLGIVWARRTHDVAMLPNRVARFHIYEPFGAEPLETLFRIQPGSDAEVFRADVYFVRAGRLLAQLQGLEGAGSQQLNRKLVSSEV